MKIELTIKLEKDNLDEVKKVIEQWVVGLKCTPPTVNVEKAIAPPTTATGAKATTSVSRGEVIKLCNDLVLKEKDVTAVKEELQKLGATEFTALPESKYHELAIAIKKRLNDENT